MFSQSRVESRESRADVEPALAGHGGLKPAPQGVAWWRVIAVGLALSGSAQATPDVQALLKKADAWRLSGESVRVETQARMYRDGKLDKERDYVVYTRSGRRSLVLMKSPVEQGQKVLMLADQFWLLMPDTQRPLRITASQKLLGEASTGDIATMTWCEDYDGKVAGEGDCPAAPAGPGKEPPARADGRCLHLDLAATRPGVTYTRIELDLDKASQRPVKADLYVTSGKRAKVAWYHAGTLDGQPRITAMSLLDDIQVTRRTEIRYLSMKPREAPDEFFNPAALVRNSLAGW